MGKLPGINLPLAYMVIIKMKLLFLSLPMLTKISHRFLHPLFVIQFNNYFVVKYVIFFQRPNTFRNSLYSSIFPLSYWYSSKSNVTRTPLILGLPIAVLKQPRSNSSGQRQWWQWGRAHCHLHTTMFIGKILGLGLEIQDYACKGLVFVLVSREFSIQDRSWSQKHRWSRRTQVFCNTLGLGLKIQDLSSKDQVLFFVSTQFSKSRQVLVFIKIVGLDELLDTINKIC